MPLPQAAWPERLSEKSGRCGIAADWRSVALYLWLIVVISGWAGAIDRCSNIWAHCRALLVLGSIHKADSLIAKFKEAGGTVREIDVWAESPGDYLRLLSASSSACHGLLIITVITPLPTKPSATKMPENWSWRTRQLLTCRCVSVMLLRLMQNKVELADAKAENDALRDDAAAGRRRLHIKAVCQSVRLPPPPAWIMQPPPDWQTLLNGIISPSERGWSLCKQLEGTQKYINEQQIELPTDGATPRANYCEQYTRASSGEQCSKVIKPSNPFTNVCWVSVLTLSALPQILAASTVFFGPISETKKWWVMVSLVLLLPVCFQQ